MISLMLLVGSGLGDVGSGDSGSGVRMLGGSGSGFTVRRMVYKLQNT